MNKNWTIVYKFGDGREVVLEPFEEATEYVFRNLYCRWPHMVLAEILIKCRFYSLLQ